MQTRTPLTTQDSTDPTEAAWAATWAAEAALDAIGDFFEDPNPVTARWLRRRLAAASTAVAAAKQALGVEYPSRHDTFTLTALGEAALVAAEAPAPVPAA
jgi:hypothetical protein